MFRTDRALANRTHDLASFADRFAAYGARVQVTDAEGLVAAPTSGRVIRAQQPPAIGTGSPVLGADDVPADLADDRTFPTQRRRTDLA